MRRVYDRSYTNYQIKGYDGQVTKAAGQGYGRIYNPDTKQTDEMLFVYTPAVSGTIISLEHHARTHPRIHRWTQEATPSDDKGKITFLAEDGTIVSSYHTLRAGGLYYDIQDLHFIPAVVDDTADTGPMEFPSEDYAEHLLVCVTAMEGMEETDYTPSLDTKHQSYLLGDQRTPANTLCVAQTEPTVKAAKEEIQYELWHQPMGHAPITRLHQMAKHVHGLPPMSANRIPSFVRCRACDIDKLKKVPRGHALPNPLLLMTGQCFHMGIGFLRGPSNLQAGVDR